MPNITRHQQHEPLSLRDAMDRLFDESFLAPFGDGGAGMGAAPAVDVCETDNEVIVTATVPGVKPDDLKITLTGDLLEISGETHGEAEHKNATYYLRERRHGSFQRAIALPTPVVADKVQAEFDNGVLKLTMPKAEDARRKTISVKPKTVNKSR